MSDQTEFEAWETYSNAVMVLVYAFDGAQEHDDAIIEMVSGYFGDGSDPLNAERASNRIVEGLGIA